MRFLLVEFEGAEIGRFSGEAVVDRGQNHAGVNRLGVRLEPEVEIHRVVNVVAAGGIRRRQVLEDVVIDLDAVRSPDPSLSETRPSVAKLRRSESVGSYAVLPGAGATQLYWRRTLRFGRKPL